jgi:NAD-dependent dihydropyrimidine dehydrogenase PreA subunit
MNEIERRAFLKKAAVLGPCLAAFSSVSLFAKKEEEGLMVLSSQCTGCGDCIEICPVDAITMKKGVAAINNDECIECASCISECPTEAILYKKDLEAYKKRHPDRFKPKVK